MSFPTVATKTVNSRCRNTRAARERSRLEEGSNAPHEAAVRLKEGSTAPLRLNAGVPGGDGVSLGNNDAFDSAEGANENENTNLDGNSDGDGISAEDGLSDGDSNSDGSNVGLGRSSRSRTWPDRLTYQQLGGMAENHFGGILSEVSGIEF